MLRPPPLPNLPGYDLLGGSRGTGAPGRENQAPKLTQTLTYKDGKPMVLDKGESLWQHQPPPRLPSQNLHHHSWVDEVTPQGIHQPNQPPRLQLLMDAAPLPRTRRTQQQDGEPQQILTETQAAYNRQGAPPVMQWTGKKTPGWLLYDKKVLRFFAFFTETLDSTAERTRTRRCHIRYHLEDDSIEIIEPVEENSGLTQGRFLRRNKVKLADGELLKWHRLRVGSSVTLYGRTFNITACDEATREHFLSHGIAMPLDVPDPRKEAAAQQAEAAPKSKSDGNQWADDELDPLATLKETKGPQAVFEVQYDNPRFAMLDRKVLRFFCCWYDPDTGGHGGKGFRIPLALHCYPIDDTMELVEVHRRNDGRDPYPKLLTRCKLPKSPNVPPVGGRPMSPRTRRSQNITYYSWRDLRVGAMIKVYGRDVLLYECDASTKQFYQDFVSLPDSAFSPLEVDFDQNVRRPTLPIPPDALGIGSEEDSLRNVLNLIPKRKPSNYNNYLDNWDKVLRFRCRIVLLPGQQDFIIPHDGSRKFVLSFYPVDNTISIFEPKQPNSGMLCGTFLERTKVYKSVPGAPTQDSSRRQPIVGSDVFVGAVLNVYSRGFELVEADEKTLTYMEENAEQHPMSDYERVLSQVQQSLSPQSVERLTDVMLAGDVHGAGQVNAKQVKDAFQRVGIDLQLQEALTLVRGQSRDGQTVTIERLLRALGAGELSRIGQRDDDWQQQQMQLEMQQQQLEGPGGPVGDGFVQAAGDGQQQRQQQRYEGDPWRQQEQWEQQGGVPGRPLEQQQQFQENMAYMQGAAADGWQQRQGYGPSARGISNEPRAPGAAGGPALEAGRGGPDLDAMAPGPRRAWEEAQQQAWAQQQQGPELVRESRVRFADAEEQQGWDEPDLVARDEPRFDGARRQNLSMGPAELRPLPPQGQPEYRGAERHAGEIFEPPRQAGLLHGQRPGSAGGWEEQGVVGGPAQAANRSHSFRAWADDQPAPGQAPPRSAEQQVQRRAVSEAGNQQRVMKQPQSLWQTTNNALGGIYHPRSHQQSGR